MAQERERESGGDAPETTADDDGDTPDQVNGNDAGEDADESDDTNGPEAGEDAADRPAVVERDAVANTFVDAAPQTVTEVVEETGLEHDTAEGTLDELVEDGVIATKTLQTGAATLRVWYQPATAHVERLASGSPDDDRAEAVEDAIDELDVPGVSDMMQSWRRDAIRGAWEYLVDHGAATDAAIIDGVYPGHSAGYNDRESWWDCVRPRLGTLPGVTPPEDGGDDVWTYVPA